MNLMIVDDHLLIRAGMKLLLKNTSAYTVTAEVESGEEALQLLAAQKIDLVIMDISMPGMGGLACSSAPHSRAFTWASSSTTSAGRAASSASSPPASSRSSSSS